MKRYQLIGLCGGLALFFLVLLMPAPAGMPPSAQRTAAVTCLMAAWWMTEAIPISATGLAPLVLFPLLGILNSEETGANYGEDGVLLLTGGFFIAKSIESNNLHRRIALVILNRGGVDRARVLLSFMAVTAFLSLWMANVTTTLMMLPIALAIVSKDDAAGTDSNGFAPALMLGIAWAATIGGCGTLVGTPTNVILVGVLKNLYPEAPPITFLTWMAFGIPMVLLMIPVTWYYLKRMCRLEGAISGGQSVIADELAELGPMTTPEKRVLVIGILTALAWLFRADIHLDSVVIPGWASLLGVQDQVHDATVAMCAALLLFTLPAGKTKGKDEPPRRLLTMQAAKTIPWDIMFIVGGGYALADAYEATGLVVWLGQELAFVVSLPTILMLFFVILAIVLITEINSNTATANVCLPILGAMAVAGGVHPLLLMIPGTVACSYAWMLPSGTGGNAAVFASGKLTIGQMIRYGFFLNFISIPVMVLVAYLIIVPLFGLSGGTPAWAQ
ncbi:MAG: SLC13/DASS family transporter [Candidatus Hydrogenedentes bacterium]|nr:SLC13/DASS family transporter [Candidatus Hydrogenedentota bacterium]